MVNNHTLLQRPFISLSNNMQSQLLYIPDFPNFYTYDPSINLALKTNNRHIKVSHTSAIALCQENEKLEYFILGGESSKGFNFLKITPSELKSNRFYYNEVNRISPRSCIFQENLYLIGGFINQIPSSSCVVFDMDQFQRNSKNVRSNNVADLNFARADFGICSTKRYIFAIGGSGKFGFMASCERYDGTQWVLLQLSLPAPSCRLGVIPIFDDFLIIIGGRIRKTDNIRGESSKTYLFDVSAGNITEYKDLKYGGCVLFPFLEHENSFLAASSQEVNHKLVKVEAENIDWIKYRLSLMLWYSLKKEYGKYI
ncbi:unnamed protein product [Blepharisma stoltei]|uniref:Kelch motif family protein n=1 Tax=Blepharisma stoltei TaxID=1481888 RepID=A0AAU9KBZ4_9CILI|nr:unnamed protein product [Blepharisma stoltei]